MSFDAHSFSSLLFWDTDPDAVRWPEHRKWLLTRVLERGTWEDWQLICRHLPVSEMAALAPTLSLQPREKNFLRNWIERRNVA